MAHHRLSTWQKATALVPLALLSGAWTTSLAMTSTATATTQDQTTLPDGTTVPDEAIEEPASMSRPGSIAVGVTGAADSMIRSASANGIPAAALAAYQRAEQVINSADAGCNLSWQLVAAIGRVESDHGRFGGNVLGDDGKSRPGIFGIPLDGSDGTVQVKDTDAGELDDDRVFDRAVGPMQFIPQTWNVVGVDGDGDGSRDPQDIDDAALASAVYLCSGDEDLSTYGGQKASVYRYNHSKEYVDLVIAVMNAYLDGEFSSVPNGVAAPTVFTPSYGDAGVTPATSGRRSGSDRSGGGGGTGSAGSSGGSGGGTSGGGDGGATDPGGEEPAGGTVEDATDEVTGTVEDTTDNTTSALDQAKQTCQENFTAEEIEALGGLTACAEAVLADGVAGVEATLEDLLGTVTDPLG